MYTEHGLFLCKNTFGVDVTWLNCEHPLLSEISKVTAKKIVRLVFFT